MFHGGLGEVGPWDLCVCVGCPHKNREIFLNKNPVGYASMATRYSPAPWTTQKPNGNHCTLVTVVTDNKGIISITSLFRVTLQHTIGKIELSLWKIQSHLSQRCPTGCESRTIHLPSFHQYRSNQFSTSSNLR